MEDNKTGNSGLHARGYIETTLQLLRTQHNISINRPFIDQLTVAQE